MITRDTIIASIPDGFDPDDVTVNAFGGGVYTITVQACVRDEVGREVAGRAELDVVNGTLRIESLRDGVAFGAKRRVTRYRVGETVVMKAWSKLRRQRAAFLERHKARVQRDWAPSEHPARYGAS